MKKKSTLIDWLIILFQIVSPIAAVLFAVLIKSQNYTIDHRLATIVAGITIQIVLQGFTSKKIKELEKENLTEIGAVKQMVEESARNTKFTSEMTAIFSSNEPRRIQYAQRRLRELETALYDVANSYETQLLPVSTYYQELNTLGDLISKDPNPQQCEIWAMTGFSNKEWDIDENTLEKDWCERLMDLVQKIQTNRVCIIDDELEQLLSMDEQYYNDQQIQWAAHEDFPELNDQKNLKSFIDYISSYYSTSGAPVKAKNVVLRKVPPAQRTPVTRTIIEAKGFFGIKLSNGEKYVIKGEAVDPQTGLQGQYVFAEEKVDELYECHKKCMELRTLEEYLIQNRAVSPGFRSFLEKNKIQFAGSKPETVTQIRS